MNGALLPKHYLCKGSVKDTVDCMGNAEALIDNKHIVSTQFSFCEDGQTVNRVGARGYIVIVWSDHQVQYIFVTFQVMQQHPSLPFNELNTVDAGPDATEALYCASIALDGDGIIKPNIQQAFPVPSILCCPYHLLMQIMIMWFKV